MQPPIIPIISKETAPFSDLLLDHIVDVESSTGRTVVFSSLEEVAKVDKAVDSLTEARVLNEPNKPVIWVLVNMRKMSKRNYRANQCEPIIAHEIGHAKLLSEGFLNISLYEGMSLLEQKAVEAVNNWLSDPLINSDIQERNFDVASLRKQEIINSTLALKRGSWRNKPFFSSLRLGVSFSLEPNISLTARQEFRKALRIGLSEVNYQKVMRVLNSINEGGFDTPKKFRNTLYSSLGLLEEILDVKIKEKKLVERFEKFSPHEQSKWMEENIVKWQSWP